MQLTQRVEGQNAIIKNLVSGGTFLITLVKHIDEQINRVSTFIQFVENIQELGLYFNSIEQVNSNEQCDSIDLTEPEKNKILNTFAEDTIDVPVILLRELVSSVNIISILKIWEVIRHRRKAKNYVVLFKNNSHLCMCLGLVQCGFVCRHFFQVMTVSSNAAFHIMFIPKRWYNDKKQIETESQTRQQPFIIRLGNRLDAGSSAIQELKDFINKFITKYMPKKRERMNTIQLKDENEVNSSSDEEDITAIENLIVHSKRGAPRKKRLKGSHKLENKNRSSGNQNSENQKTRKPTQCQ
ncbi:protein far1-related sequence 5-like [Gigaspora margarita]|uniref:Protein far1-related sequence 5-like n=1 Tax=Gigaspora margarita TaxID=4874 RepID=A0A8H4EK91_GIGMA|nr:protein far1-related sequence 5-like [Gigaspora margarita]